MQASLERGKQCRPSTACDTSPQWAAQATRRPRHQFTRDGTYSSCPLPTPPYKSQAISLRKGRAVAVILGEVEINYIIQKIITLSPYERGAIYTLKENKIFRRYLTLPPKRHIFNKFSYNLACSDLFFFPFS